MTETCFLCGAEHSFRECPMMADTKTYLDAFAPKADRPPPEEPSRSSLAPTLLEEMYGPDAVNSLLDVVEEPEVLMDEHGQPTEQPSRYSEEQRELAWLLLSGQKDLRSLTRDEMGEVNEIARRMYWDEKPGTPTQEIRPKPAFEQPPRMQMPDLDRPPAPDAEAPIVESDWPDLDEG